MYAHRCTLHMNMTNAEMNMEETATNSEHIEKKTKKRKMNDSQQHIEKITTLENIEFVKILQNDISSKTIFLHGKYTPDNGTEKDAVIKLEKCQFTDKDAGKLFSADTQLSSTFQNDIYGQHVATINSELNVLKAVTIMPATEKHLSKYSKQDFYFVNETPKDYEDITLPHIQKSQHNLQWVYNILEHKSEADRIIFEDSDPDVGFILLPDLKWNEKQTADLHLTAIIVKKGIGSIRDLRAEHLPMLENILTKGKGAVAQKYKLLPGQLRIYFHYHPTYYHLHVHFTAITNISASCAAGKAHLLEDVIDNIKNIDACYYKKKTLGYILGHRDPLLKKFVDAGKLVCSHSDSI